jgi:hypothetical protein
LKHASAATAIAVRDVSLPYLLSLPIPARAQEKRAHVRTHPYYDDGPARRQANSIARSRFCLAKFLVQRDCRKSTANGDKFFFFKDETLFFRPKARSAAARRPMSAPTGSLRESVVIAAAIDR